MSNANINLAINATANLASTNAALEAMRRGMAGVREEVNKYHRSMQTTGRDDRLGFEKSLNNVDALRSGYASLIDQSGLYNRSMKNITSATTDFNNRLMKQKIGLKDVVGQFGQVRAAMKEQMALNRMMVQGWRRDATGKIQADLWVPKTIDLKTMASMRAQLGYYNEVLKSVSTNMVNLGKNTQWAGRQLTVGFSVPISIAIGLLGKLGAAADQELIRITKVYGDTESAFQASNESLRNMAQETARYIADQYGIAATETRNVMAELAATGLEGPELQRMTMSTQRLSLLGDLQPDESLKLMRVLKEVYGFTSSELDKQVDYFNAIENATALTMQDIGEGLPRIAGLMKSTGVSIEEQTELLVAFKSAGVDVAEGANALKSINFKAVAATPTAAKSFFRITGVEMQDLIDKTEGQFIPMMLEIANVMEDLDQQAKVDLVARVFGIHQGNRAITLLEQLQNASEGLVRAQEVGMTTAEERAATANKEIEAIQEAVGTRFKRMIASMKASLEPMGILALEAVIPLGNAIAGLLEKINNLSERSKKLVLFGSLLLAGVGPLVMFVGLLGNLLGTGFRTIAFLGGLAVKFKLLSSEGKAAAVIQKALDSEMDRATQGMNDQTVALGNLAKALDGVNRSMQEQLGLTSQVGSATYTPQIAGNTAAEMRAVGGTDAQRRAAQIRAVHGAPMQQTQRERVAAQMRAMHNAPVRSVIPSDAETARLYKEIGKQNAAIQEQNRLVEKTRQGWVSVGGTITAASAAMYGLGSVTDTQWVQKLSIAAMMLGSFSPLIGSISTTMGQAMAKSGAWSSGIAGKIGDTFKKGVGAAKGALGSLATFMMGPWGLAIAGAALVAFAFWDRHRKQLKEVKEMYESLADSAELLGKTYDFQPMSRLEREAAKPGYDEDTMHGQSLRIQDMEENNKELYDVLKQREKYIRDHYKDVIVEGTRMTERQMEAYNEAIRQGNEVMRNTGDEELAKRAAWDVYSIVSDEWLSFEQFKIRFEPDFGSLDSTAEQASRYLADKMRDLERNRGLFRPFDPKYIEEVRAATREALDAALDIPDMNKRTEVIEQNFGELNDLLQFFQRGQKEGWIDADETFEEYATNFTSRFKGMSNVTRDSNAEMLLALREFGFTKQQAQELEILAQVAEERIPQAFKEATAAGVDFTEMLSGLYATRTDLTDWAKIDRLLDEQATTSSEERKAAIQAEINAEILRGTVKAELHNQEVVRRQEADRQLGNAAGLVGALAGGLTDAGKAGLEMGEDVSQGAQEAKTALEQLTRPQRQQYDAFKTSMEELQSNTIDYYRQQMVAMHDAERKAFDEQAARDMKDVEDAHDVIEKDAEAKAKQREKRLENRHEREKKALDAEKEAAMELMDDRREQLKARQDRESEALSERYKRLNKELKDSQEDRRKQIEATYDKQVEAIENQIKKEEELEKQRQRMFEAEKERISRMQQLFNQNISLNMAVNTGDLDEAARIASQMASQQSEWATDDLSRISSDASESRRDKMRGQIDRLQEEKRVELDNIKEIEEAELESLKKREEEANKALKAKFKRLEDELAAERKMLDKSFQLRSENLSKRQKAQDEALREALAEEREQRATNRKEAVAAQEEITSKNKAELDKQLADAAASFEDRAEYWSGMVAKDYDEWRTNNRAMLRDFGKVLGDDLKELDAEKATELWKQRRRTQREELDHMANDDAWADAARIIVDQITAGIFGFDFTAKQMEAFLRTGKLPPAPSRTSRRGGSNLYRDAKHSGGVAGVDAPSYSGPGYTGRHQEIDATLLKGEGVLNLRAMNTPGVPEMMHALNKGYTKKSPIANYTDHKGDARAGGQAGGYPVMAAITAGIMKQFARVASLTGLEVGMSKAEQAISGVNIKLGKDQAMGLSAEQLRNAEAIISTGRRLGAGNRDIITALMTAMQESSMRNLGYGDDIHGVRNPDGSLTSSLGLFQQQKWWGTRGERLDPYKSSELFYRALFGVKGRDSMPLWAAAQSVQRSAYPQAYAKWEDLARVLLGGAATGETKISSKLSTQDRLKALKERYEQYEESQKGFMYPTTGMISWLYGWRNMSAMGRRDFHNGLDIRAPGGTPVFATAPGRATIGWDSYGGGNFVKIDHGNGIGTGYFHLSRRVAKPGQQVQRGTYIGQVGNTGRLSFGNHLHFSVLRNGSFIDPAPFMNSKPYVGKYVRPEGVQMRTGGLVPGRGFGDITPAMLEPGEFVVRKNVTDNNLALLNALNNGTIDMDRKAGSIDNSRSANYNVIMNFKGAVNSEIDFKRAVKKVLIDIDKSKAQNRNID